MSHGPQKARTLADPDSGAKLLTSAEAGRYLKYHPGSLRRLVSSGDLRPQMKVGRVLLFLREELDRFKYGSAWASRKSGIKSLPNPPPKPSSREHMAAIVTVTLDGRDKAFKRLKIFRWEDIPTIRSQVDTRYGKVSFCITIEPPDGCAYEVRFHPSALAAEHYGILRKKRGRTHPNG